MYGVNRRLVVSAVGLLAACAGLTTTAVADNACNGKKVHNGEPCINHLVDAIPNVGPRQDKCEGLGPYNGPPPCNGFVQPKSVALNYKCSDGALSPGVVNCGPKLTWASSPIGPVPVHAQGVCFRYRRCQTRPYSLQCLPKDEEETLERPLYEEVYCNSEPPPPPGGD